VRKNEDAVPMEQPPHVPSRFGVKLAGLYVALQTVSGRLRRAYERLIIREFHKIAYRRKLWYETHWLGRRVMQYPSDLIIKQEIIYKLRPALLIETGTAHGGSALFYASLFDMLDHGRVITIDIDGSPDRPVHPRIEYFTGSSVAAATVAHVMAQASAAGGPVMVTLDSLHTCEHVLAEMEAYHGCVTPGSYMIVEDGEMYGHPVYTDWPPEKDRPGPYEAVMQFLPRHPEFEPDRTCERYLITGHPNGWLRRRPSGTPA
jgi:cephalosporin hydroxylase